MDNQNKYTVMCKQVGNKTVYTQVGSYIAHSFQDAIRKHCKSRPDFSTISENDGAYLVINPNNYGAMTFTVGVNPPAEVTFDIKEV